MFVGKGKKKSRSVVQSLGVILSYKLAIDNYNTYLACLIKGTGQDFIPAVHTHKCTNKKYYNFSCLTRLVSPC